MIHDFEKPNRLKVIIKPFGWPAGEFIFNMFRQKRRRERERKSLFEAMRKIASNLNTIIPHFVERFIQYASCNMNNVENDAARNSPHINMSTKTS
jgi:hypothetical protein